MSRKTPGDTIANRLQSGDRESHRHSSSNSETADFADDVRGTLEIVTQETRFELIQDIAAHPQGMPSLKELDYANPSKSKSTVRNHLEKLVESGIVEEVALPEDERTRDLPWKFYRLPDSGRDFLERYDLLRAEETLERMYSMLEKTDRIEKYENAPRPTVEGREEQESDGKALK